MRLSPNIERQALEEMAAGGPLSRATKDALIHLQRADLLMPSWRDLGRVHEQAGGKGMQLTFRGRVRLAWYRGQQT